MYCLETHELTHQFSEKETVLRNINLRVSEGSIYGFLGPNGAGKTTTLRLILGLLKKQKGEISIFGRPFEQDRLQTLKKIGSLIESPSLYSQLTALENLEVFRKVYQSPKERLPEVLKLVGLTGTGKKKAGQFSLGMKQRLSIAIALLHHPSFIILDEPTNGLDPNGIIEIRELLIKLNKENGITVLISSHLLSEIEKLVSHVGVIHKGNMLFQGTLDELVSKQRQSSGVIFETNDNEKALLLIRDLHAASQTKDGQLIFPVISREQVAEINQQLVQGGINVFQISTAANSLESVFMDLTNN